MSETHQPVEETPAVVPAAETTPAVAPATEAPAESSEPPAPTTEPTETSAEPPKDEPVREEVTPGVLSYKGPGIVK
jgi:hypothetical protein